MKNNIYSWVNSYVKLIKLKYQKNENIFKLKDLVYTQDKTVSYEIKNGLWEKLEKKFILKDKEKNMNKLILNITMKIKLNLHLYHQIQIVLVLIIKI